MVGRMLIGNRYQEQRKGLDAAPSFAQSYMSSGAPLVRVNRHLHFGSN